jgi:DNA-binding transcriptional LysR family regulator
MKESEKLAYSYEICSRGAPAMQWHERIKGRVKLRELHMLDAVVQSGSMARAATHLGLSQSAVSKSITEMEHTLGVPLLDRTSRGVEPTAFGRILLKRSVVIFDELGQGLREIEHLNDPTGGELRIGTTEPMTAIVATVIDRLSRQYARMTFHVTVNGSIPLLFSELQERNLDLAIFRMASASPGKDFKGEVLFQDPLAVMTGLQNPWVHRRNIELADLMAEPWILPPPDISIGQYVTEAFRARGLAIPRSAVVTSSVHMRHNMLVTGRFVAMLPSAMLKFPPYRGSLTALPIELPETRKPIGLITLKKRDLSPVAKLFARCAREVVRPLVVEK